MQGDSFTGASAGADSGTGSVLGGGYSATNPAPNSVEGVLLKSVFGGGSGRAAARGAAQYSVLLARNAARAAANASALSIATMNAAAQSARTGVPTTVQNLATPTKALLKLLQTAAQIRQQLLSARDLRQKKRLALEQAVLQKKILHAQQGIAPQYVPIAEYGIVNGGPLRGSRDDPSGTLDVRAFALSNYGRL